MHQFKCLVCIYGISIIVGYLMPNLVYSFILNMNCEHKSLQLNSLKYCYVLLYRHWRNDKDAVTKTDVVINDAWRKTSLQKYIPLTLLQGFERVVQGFHERGSWRSNINCNILIPLLWPPRCVFLVLLMLGSTP